MSCDYMNTTSKHNKLEDPNCSGSFEADSMSFKTWAEVIGKRLNMFRMIEAAAAIFLSTMMMMMKAAKLALAGAVKNSGSSSWW